MLLHKYITYYIDRIIVIFYSQVKKQQNMIQSQASTSTIPNQSVQKVEIVHYQTSTCNCHFTLCQKQGQTITIVSHSRILIYNQNTSLIYYINQLPKQPNKIQEALNKPKKESVVVNSVEVKNQAKTKILSVIFNKNGEKGSTTAVQWKFVMDGPAVAENWVNFIKNKKQQKITKALAQYQKNQTQPKFLLDSNIPSDNTNINNTNYNNNTNPNNTTNPNSTNNNNTNLNNPKVTTNDQKNTNQNNTDPNKANLNKTNDPKMTNSTIVYYPNSSLNQKQPTPPTNTESKPTTYNNTSSKIVQKNTYSSKEQSPPKTYLNTSQDPYNNTRQSKPTYHPTNVQRKPQESTIKKPIQKQQQSNLNISRESNQPSTYSNPNNPNNSNINQNKQNVRINQSSNPPQNTNTNTSYSRYNKPTTNQKTQQPKAVNRTKIQEPKITESRAPTQYNMNTSNPRDTKEKNRQNAQNTNENKRPTNRNAAKNQSPYSQRISDWNLQFLTKHNQTTLNAFSAHCLQIFQSLDPSSIVLSSYPQSRQSNPSKNQPLTLIRNNIVFQMAADRTKLSQKLKNQYNNYHYIVECCKNSKIINVPLCCIIQYLGIVCLAKVQIKYGGDGNADGEIVNLRDNKGRMTQKQKDIGQQLKMLQMFTKISSEIIKKQAIIVNMSRVYGKQGNNYCIYIDNLYNYLPYHPQQPQLQIRPQLIIDNISSTLSSQQEHSQRQLQSALNQSFTQICQELSKHHLIPISYIDIKNIIHSYGLTLSILPDLYGKVRSRFLKKYIYTILVCTILRDEIITSIIDFRQNNQSSGIIQSIEEALRIYTQIGANKDYEQIWNNMQKQFKKKYKINFNINEVQHGFFISTIMWMLGGQYNLNKLDKSKRLFKDNNIILEGFMIELKPKIKCYHRFLSQLTQRIITQTRNSQSTLDQLLAILPQLESETPIQLLSLSSPVKQRVILHLSKLLPPSSHHSHHPHIQSFIYSPQYINKQPPIQFTHQLTIIYANHCNKLGDHDQYKQTIQKSVDILSYWLGEDSVLLCDVFQSLGEYYGNKGNRDDCINFMKQALTTSIRSLGTHSTKVGLQYYKLAQKQLKYGDIAQAYETFLKSKQNLQQQDTVQSVYPLVLFKLGTLSLQFSNPQKCIIFSIQALKSCEHAPLPDKNLIKIYDLLSRAYELNHTHLSAKVFNNTTDPNLLQQMLRICLVGFIFTLQPIKQQKIQQFLLISGIIGLSNRMKGGQDYNNTEEQKTKIKKIAEKFVVMQKWYKQIQVIQRYVSQIKSKRPISGEGKQFMDMFGAIVKIVGVEFVEGVLTQAKYY